MEELIDLVTRLSNIETKTLLYIYDQLCYSDDQSDASVVSILHNLICSFEKTETCEIVQSIVNTSSSKNMTAVRECFQRTLMKEPSSSQEVNVVDSVYEYAVQSSDNLIKVREKIAKSIEMRGKSAV